MKTYIILGLLVGLVGAVNGDEGYYHNTKTFNTNIEEDNYGTGADRQILNAARDIIGNDDISIDVMNGKITLQGKVANQQEKAQILTDLRGLKGVRSIDAQLLTVNPENAASSSQKSSSLW